MIDYFFGVLTVDAIKKHYRQLAMLHHPDIGGDHETMQEINKQYHKALKGCHGQTTQTDTGKEYAYRYDEALEQSVVEAIAKLIALQMPNVTIALIGTWVWIVGDTKPYKDAIKAIGCKWHRTRECWFFSAHPHKGFYSRSGFDGLAARYGYADLTSTNKAQRITA